MRKFKPKFSKSFIPEETDSITRRTIGKFLITFWSVIHFKYAISFHWPLSIPPENIKNLWFSDVSGAYERNQWSEMG